MIIFIRHGQTDYNLKNLVQGKINIPLNQTGINQANNLAEKLKDLKVDKIYCSPLDRTVNTSKIVNKYHNAPIITDKRIEELGFGPYEGTDKTEFFKVLNTEKEKLFNTKGVEKIEDIKNRIKSFYDEIKNTDETVLIVSHGGVFKILAKMLNMEKENSHITNCQDVVIER